MVGALRFVGCRPRPDSTRRRVSRPRVFWRSGAMVLGPAPPNSTLKPSRPGFGPAAEPPGPNITRSASRWLQIASARMLTRTSAATAPLVS